MDNLEKRNYNFPSIIYDLNLWKERSKINKKILVRGELSRTEYYIPELGRWVNTKSMKSSLRKIGMTQKDYYDKYLSPYPTPPRCKVPGCTEYCLFKSISEGYTYTCSSYHSKVLGNITRNKDRVYKTYKEECKNNIYSYAGRKKKKPYNHSYYNKNVLNCSSIRVTLSQVYKFNFEWIHRVIGKIKRTTIDFIGVNRIELSDNRLRGIDLPINKSNERSIVKYWEFNYNNDLISHNFRLLHPFIYKRFGKTINTYLIPFSLYRNNLWNWIYVFIYSLDTPSKRLDFISIKDSRGFTISYYIPELYSKESSKNTNQAITRDSKGLYNSRKIYNKNILLEDYNYTGPVCSLTNCSNNTPFRSIKFGYRVFCCEDHELKSHKEYWWIRKRAEDSITGVIKNILSEDQIKKIDLDSLSYEDKKYLVRTNSDINRRYGYNNIKRGWYNSSKGISNKFKRTIFYRSLYELAYFIILDKDDSVVKYFSEPRLNIQYIDVDGRIRHYFPDLLIYYSDGSIEMHEVKPKKLIKDGTNLRKFEAAIEYCSKNRYKIKYIVESDIFKGIRYNEILKYHNKLITEYEITSEIISV